MSRCSRCGLANSWITVPAGDRHWVWADGRRFLVERRRCLGCAALETVERDFAAAYEDVKPARGTYMATDGVRHIATEIDPIEMTGGDANGDTS